MSRTNSKKSGIVFNIQKYSVHDGPGIRTVAFIKGCPLSCKWCCNPESQNPYPQLAYNRDKCLTFENCIRCKDVCTADAIQKDGANRARINRELCSDCLLCTENCPPLALKAFGQEVSVDQVISSVEEDGAFYSRSGGGLTLSGGEPMHQPDFAIALLQEARRRRIHTAMETCGHCKGADLETACGSLNTLLYDIKVMNPQKHKQFTGVTNELILANLKRVCTAHPNLPVLVRTPIIPGINDSQEEIRLILEFIQNIPNVRYEMLPYHRMGKPKYEYLGNDFPMGDTVLDDDTMVCLHQLVHNEFNHLAVNANS